MEGESNQVKLKHSDAAMLRSEVFLNRVATSGQEEPGLPLGSFSVKVVSLLVHVEWRRNRGV